MKQKIQELSIVVALALAISGRGFGFCPENVFTVPLAAVPAADLVVEAALDTVLLPADACLAGVRERKSKTKE